MKKRDLVRLIESENKRRINLNEDFYFNSEMFEEIEAPTFDPLEKISTDVDYGTETRKQKSKIAKVVNCENEKQSFNIKPKKNTSIGDVLMISDGGNKYCVEVVKMIHDDPDEYEIIGGYNECTDCIIDLKLSEKSGGFSLGGSTATKERENQGYQEITPNKGFVPDFGKKVQTQGLPQARKRKPNVDFDDIEDYDWEKGSSRSEDIFESIRKDFKSKLNTIDNIINQKNKYMR